PQAVAARELSHRGCSARRSPDGHLGHAHPDEALLLLDEPRIEAGGPQLRAQAVQQHVQLVLVAVAAPHAHHHLVVRAPAALLRRGAPAAVLLEAPPEEEEQYGPVAALDAVRGVGGEVLEGRLGAEGAFEGDGQLVGVALGGRH
ncbi:MAG: hypothetical protein ACK559_14925, partial [bacterium]